MNVWINIVCRVYDFYQRRRQSYAQQRRSDEQNAATNRQRITQHSNHPPTHWKTHAHTHMHVNTRTLTGTYVCLLCCSCAKKGILYWMWCVCVCVYLNFCWKCVHEYAPSKIAGTTDWLIQLMTEYRTTRMYIHHSEMQALAQYIVTMQVATRTQPERKHTCTIVPK